MKVQKCSKKLCKIWVSGSDLLRQRSFESQKWHDSLESTRDWPWKWQHRAGACSPPGGRSWRPWRPEIWLTVPWRSSLWGFRVNAWPVLPQCLRSGPWPQHSQSHLWNPGRDITISHSKVGVLIHRSHKYVNKNSSLLAWLEITPYSRISNKSTAGNKSTAIQWRVNVVLYDFLSGMSIS